MPHLLSVKNVFLRSGNKPRKEILKNINLSLEENGIIILKGPPGSGKSALIEVLSGRCSPSSGEVFFKDRNLYKMKSSEKKKFRRLAAWAPEKDNYLSHLSLYDNLAEIIRLQRLPSKEAFDRIMHVLKFSGLIASRELLPGKLSSSEKKLFKLAMTLIREPELVMLDFNLCSDFFSSDVFRRVKEIAARGAAVILTAKEGTELKAPPRMCLDMENGCIL